LRAESPANRKGAKSDDEELTKVLKPLVVFLSTTRGSSQSVVHMHVGDHALKKGTVELLRKDEMIDSRHDGGEIKARFVGAGDGRKDKGEK
jgi:hypothetical protein